MNALTVQHTLLYDSGMTTQHRSATSVTRIVIFDDERLRRIESALVDDARCRAEAAGLPFPYAGEAFALKPAAVTVAVSIAVRDWLAALDHDGATAVVPDGHLRDYSQRVEHGTKADALSITIDAPLAADIQALGGHLKAAGVPNIRSRRGYNQKLVILLALLRAGEK